MRTPRKRLLKAPRRLLRLGLLLVVGCTVHPSVPLPTLGGLELWTDVRWRDGWRVQRHAWTGHHRLLDANDWRRAWGGLEDCERALDQRVSQATERDHLVLLLHGLGRSRHSLARLEEELAHAGFATARLGYASTRSTPAEAAADVAAVLDHLPGVRRVSFVTHSMGGILLRELLARDDPWRARLELGRAVLIAPPSRGAALARRLVGLPPVRWGIGPALAVLARSAADVAPPLPAGLPTLVVAGGRGGGGWNPLVPGDDDGVVGVEETRIAGTARFDVHGLHTFLMDHPRVQSVTCAFLAAP